MVVVPGEKGGEEGKKKKYKSKGKVHITGFSLKQRSKNENGEPEMLEVTVYDYIVNYRNIDLRYSGDLPCINESKYDGEVGKRLHEIVPIPFDHLTGNISGW